MFKDISHGIESVLPQAQPLRAMSASAEIASQ